MDLVEREEALSALNAAREALDHGRGGCALVHGEAGIGKSSLLKAVFRAESRSARQRVLWGGCEALFSPRPLGPLYDMASNLGSEVRALLGQDGQRSALFAALLEELRHAKIPTILIFEDVHWADAATLDLLKYLARRIEGAAILLVLSYRDDEISDGHPLRLLLGDLPTEDLTRIALNALSEAGVEQLARRFQARRQGLHATTRGNPFFVIESLRGEGVPATVRDAVLARAARQGAGVRALLDLVAIVPSHVEIDLVNVVMAPKPEHVAAALACGLLVADAQRFSFRHELARLAIEGHLAPPAAARLHARVLAQLEAAGTADHLLARKVHHAAGARQADAVLRYAPRAGAWAALHGAHREAAMLYRAALEQEVPWTDTARADLLERYAYQCYLFANVEPAVQARQEALVIWRRLGDRQREGHNLRWLSRLHWFLGQNPAAVTFADEALSVLQAESPGTELAWALSNRAQMHMLAGQNSDAIALGLRANSLGLALGDIEVQAHALNNVGTARYADEPAQGRAELSESLQLALRHGFSEHVARAYVNLVSNAVLYREYGHAKHVAAEATQYFAARDLNAWVDYLATLTARLDLELGLWQSATDTAMQLVERRNAMPVSRMPALVVVARLRMRRGDPGMREILAEATDLARAIGEPQRLRPMAVAHAEAAWLQLPGADLSFAKAVHLQAIEEGDARFIGELGFWLTPFGATDPNQTHLMEPPYAAQCAGQWAQAALMWRELGCPFEQALALLAVGEEGPVREGLTILASLGATATVQRCRSLLRLKGVKRVARGPRATTQAHPAGLTQREAQILALLAEGLSNTEIASRVVRSAKTVDHQVSAILGKLQARSRSEASAMAVAMGLLAKDPRGRHV